MANIFSRKTQKNFGARGSNQKICHPEFAPQSVLAEGANEVALLLAQRSEHKSKEATGASLCGANSGWQIFWLRTTTAVILILFASSTYAQESYTWEVKRVLDGDTVEISQNFLPANLKLFVRIDGIDTPESGSRAKCIEEKALAIKAKEMLRASVSEAQNRDYPIIFSNIRWDKYGGRILAKVSINGLDMSQKLIRKGLAKEYHGKKKTNWCL